MPRPGGGQVPDEGTEGRSAQGPLVDDAGPAKPLLDKLGVKPRARVSVIGIRDRGFVQELRRRGADVSMRARRGSDLVFLFVDRSGGLTRLISLESSIDRAGAIWVVFPKGRKDIREVDVIAAGLAAGLVDNKVVRFSDSHTSLRFVVPLARR
jgi:hypothetical protein